MQNNFDDAAEGGGGAESALGAPPGAIAPAALSASASSRGGALGVSRRTHGQSRAEARRRSSSSRCAFGSGARWQACRGVGSSLRPEP